MGKRKVRKEAGSDICLKTGEKFSDTQEQAKRCERCKFYYNCPCLSLFKRTRVVEGKINVVCPETEDLIDSSQCSGCRHRKTCPVWNL